MGLREVSLFGGKMPTDLEKQFFDTFGIEPAKGCTAYDELDEEIADSICKDYCPECFYHKKVYPQITDSVLLNLVLIMNPYGVPIGVNLEEFKQHILEICIGKANDIKHQVQQLFKE